MWLSARRNEEETRGLLRRGRSKPALRFVVRLGTARLGSAQLSSNNRDARSSPEFLHAERDCTDVSETFFLSEKFKYFTESKTFYIWYHDRQSAPADDDDGSG